MTREAVIVAAARTPVGKAKRGSLVTVRPDDLAAMVIKDLLKRASALDPVEIEDIVIGCAFPEGEQGLNMARMIALRSGLLTLSPPKPSIVIALQACSPLRMSQTRFNPVKLRLVSQAALNP